MQIVDEEDEDIQVLASNLNAGRRNSIDMLDDEEEEWRAAEMDLVDSDDDGGPRRRTQRRVRRNRPSRAAAADPNLPTLGKTTYMRRKGSCISLHWA